MSDLAPSLSRLRDTTEVLRPILTSGMPEVDAHLKSGAFQAYLAERPSLQERMDGKARLMEASNLLERGGTPFMYVAGIQEKLRKFSDLLSVMNEPVRQRLHERIEDIACPSAEVLETNGIFARKVLKLGQFPNIRHELSELLSKRYWLEREGFATDFRKLWQIPKGILNIHPLLSERIATPDRRNARFDCDSVLRLAALLDPDVRAVVMKIEIDGDSESRADQRKKIRESLEEANILTFGEGKVSHFNNSGFGGEVLLTQRALNALSFSGHLSFDQVGLPIFHSDGYTWSTTEQLQQIFESATPAALRIAQSLHRAARKNGFHAVGQFHENAVLDLFGLDDRISWSMDKHSGNESTYYGSEKFSLNYKALPNPAVALTDDVMLGWHLDPSCIAKYANSLISVAQFQELMIDMASLDTEGKITWKRPSFGIFLIDDTRYELQSRGCLSLI